MEFIPIKRKPKIKQIKKSVKSTKINTKIKNVTQEKSNKKLKKTNKVRAKHEMVKKKNKKKMVATVDSENEKDEDENDKIIEDESLDESESNNEKKNDNDNDNDFEDDIDRKEKTFARKCQMMDEKKKNRLFIKFRKKIHSEAVVKELHPDIRGVIFPRKKRTRWCWAVFASEEKADQALKALSKKKDILVNKPNPYDQVYMKQQKKLKTVRDKREARKKFVKMWT